MAALVTWDANNNPSVWNSLSSSADTNAALGAAINNATKITDQNDVPVTVFSFIPNTGIVPNGTPGSGYLVNGCPLNVWFGQGWVPGQQAALAQFGIVCGSTGAPISASPAMPAPGTAVVTNSSGSPAQGQLTPFGISTSAGTAASNSVVAAAIAPSLTPGTPGAVPPGSTVGQTATPLGQTVIYRFILQDTTTGVFHTGANYAGCSQVNSALCDPQDFNTLQDAVNYANSRGETPYIVGSAAEVWSIINGTTPINPAQIYGASSGISPLMLGAAALVAYLVLRK